jgi:glycosyltransferase involved in cell wall biosynthesis
MRIAYLNHSLATLIGGGTHARETLEVLRRRDDVEIVAYPAVAASGAAAGRLSPSRKRLFLPWVPPVVRLAYRLWLKPLGGQASAIEAVVPRTVEAIVFRPDTQLRLVRSIKERWPGAHLCIEINALMHAEALARVPPRGFWLRREAGLIGRADSVMVVSRHLRDVLADLGLPSERILVNHNGVNPARFDLSVRMRRSEIRHARGIPDDAFVFGYVGGMETFRRLPLMAEHALAVMREEPRAHLIVAGDGHDRARVQAVIRAAEGAVRDRVHDLGVVPHPEVPALLSAFDCALFPYSNPYGSPQKLFEYLAMGLLVIGPDVPAVREVFEDGRHLWLVGQSGGDFEAHMRRAMAHPDEGARLGENGRRLVLDRYTWAANAARLVAFLRERMATPSTSADGSNVRLAERSIRRA